MKLSVVIPVHNEEAGIRKPVEGLSRSLKLAGIEHELVLVNDNSTDNTQQVLSDLAHALGNIRIINSQPPKGFGRAIRKGLDNVLGDIVVIFMGDGSDDAGDVLMYYKKILEGYDCVFGSRFVKGSRVEGYPKLKLMLNRLGNKLIQFLFLIKYNDASNAFKCYRTEVIKAVQPLVSQSFNITVEIPLKAIIRGFSFVVVPINWNGRESGVSKYHIRELSRKYFSRYYTFGWKRSCSKKRSVKRARAKTFV